MPPRRENNGAYLTDKRKQLILDFKAEALPAHGIVGSGPWCAELFRFLIQNDPLITIADFDNWVNVTHTWILEPYVREADALDCRKRRSSRISGMVQGSSHANWTNYLRVNPSSGPNAKTPRLVIGRGRGETIPAAAAGSIHSVATNPTTAGWSGGGTIGTSYQNVGPSSAAGSASSMSGGLGQRSAAAGAFGTAFQIAGASSAAGMSSGLANQRSASTATIGTAYQIAGASSAAGSASMSSGLGYQRSAAAAGLYGSPVQNNKGPNPGVFCGCNDCVQQAHQMQQRFSQGHRPNMANMSPAQTSPLPPFRSIYPNAALPNLGYPNYSFNSPIPCPPSQMGRMSSFCQQQHGLYETRTARPVQGQQYQRKSEEQQQQSGESLNISRRSVIVVSGRLPVPVKNKYRSASASLPLPVAGPPLLVQTPATQKDTRRALAAARDQSMARIIAALRALEAGRKNATAKNDLEAQAEAGAQSTAQSTVPNDATARAETQRRTEFFFRVFREETERARKEKEQKAASAPPPAPASLARKPEEEANRGLVVNRKS